MKPKAFLSLIFTLIMLLSLTLPAYAQTTGTGASASGLTAIGGTLDTGTASVNIPSGTANSGTADPVSITDLDDLGGSGNSLPPTGQSFLSEGITVNLFGTAGPLTTFANPVQVCFPNPGSGAVRFWDATNSIWQIMPTTSVGGQLCTSTSVPGTFAVIG